MYKIYFVMFRGEAKAMAREGSTWVGGGKSMGKWK